MDSPKKAIKEIVNRIQSFLPIFNYKTAASSIAFFSPREVIQKNFSLEMETLVIFSHTIVEEVCFELANLLTLLAKQNHRKEDFKFSYLEQSFIIVMECIIDSLEFIFKKSYLEIRQYSKNNKKQIFGEKTAKSLAKIMCEILFSREHDEYSEMIEKYSGRVFTFLSHANFQVLWSKIEVIFDQRTWKLACDRKVNTLPEYFSIISEYSSCSLENRISHIILARDFAVFSPKICFLLFLEYCRISKYDFLKINSRESIIHSITIIKDCSR
eukprot:Anaeramoba_flamelloidesc36228_g1_i3.p1 GENE.c36228_g1_i3~~c36228_g1_i3.p1  ORF type:complete len:270 (+),score=37.25 c36228_g1_i3:18-827(+)